jgi:hypothetical protein
MTFYFDIDLTIETFVVMPDIRGCTGCYFKPQSAEFCNRVNEQLFNEHPTGRNCGENKIVFVQEDDVPQYLVDYAAYRMLGEKYFETLTKKEVVTP